MEYAVVETIVGDDDVVIRSVHATEVEARQHETSAEHVRVLPVYYRSGSQPLRSGDRVPTWLEGSTRWVMP